MALIGGILSGLQVGVGLLDSIQSSRANRKASQEQMKLIDQQIGASTEQISAIREAFAQKEQRAIGRFGENLDTLLSRVSRKIESENMARENAFSKSGFATQGTIDTSMDLTKRDIKRNTRDETRQMSNSFSDNLIDLATNQREIISGIQTSIFDLQQQRKIAEQESKSRFLGIF